AFSTNGNTVASAGGQDRTVKLWRGSDGQLLHTLAAHAVSALAFSPNGSKVAFVDDTISLFRVSDGGVLWGTSAYPWNFSNIAYSRDGSTIAVAESYLSSFRVTMRNETNGAIFQTITNLSNAVVTLTFSMSN